MNQSGRMEKAREALDHVAHGGKFRAALAEVEEWEARLEGLRLHVTEAEHAFADADQRAEAAEAEADRLKAALTDNNVWITAMLQTAAIRDNPGIAGANARMRLNAAALAPADRNTT